MEEGRRLGETAEAERLLSLARRLLEKGGALESTMSGERIDRTVLAEALERRIEMNAAVGSPLTSKAAAAEALTNAESALNKRAGGALKEKFVGMEEGRRQPVRYPEDVFGISDALLRWHSTILEYFGPPAPPAAKVMFRQFLHKQMRSQFCRKQIGECRCESSFSSS